ncbi:MAG: N-acetylglucosamine-6-sulfatase [Planctomycetota bacterium]|jgi:N-acetylglucosamine-6-sulfatase
MPLKRACPMIDLRPLLLVAAGLAGCGSEAQEAADERPNLLVIYTDDQRFDAWSMGGSPYIETPHLDRIAQEGAWFPRSYASTSRCCPSRASFLTGMSSHSTGVISNHPDFDVLERHPSFVDALDQAGYDTAYIGKWHLPNAGAQPVRGFDHWVSYEGPGKHFDQSFNVDGEMRTSTGHQADLLVDYALEFISQERDGPFCLIVAFKNPHVPLTPAAPFAGSIDPASVRLPASLDDDPASLNGFYARLVTSEDSRHAIEDREAFKAEVAHYNELVLSVDAGVGRLFDALETSQQLDQTAILFTTDNGQLLGEHGLQQKGISYEPSIRTPLAMRLPGRIPAGTRAPGLALNLDLAPTLLELAGVAPLKPMDGRSLLPELTGKAEGRERFLYLAPGFGGGKVVERAMVERRYKYVRLHAEGHTEEMLFDLEQDPDERVNLMRRPALQSEVVRLRDLMDAELSRLGE